ncbi:hypothetical protein SKAU_G00348010 [Synaphobranchus kaupii]|uniref:Uncharacterized protein n=1 Tax=Synaphobranchus kaupii TaxID=118154 RepID=A0A9Q1IFR5_SYNKA|nr:hypothetical protein SKAU_G00348010 [Synaphobranchus kaupii]
MPNTGHRTGMQACAHAKPAETRAALTRRREGHTSRVATATAGETLREQPVMSRERPSPLGERAGLMQTYNHRPAQAFTERGRSPEHCSGKKQTLESGSLSQPLPGGRKERPYTGSTAGRGRDAGSRRGDGYRSPPPPGSMPAGPQYRNVGLWDLFFFLHDEAQTRCVHRGERA